MLPAHSPDIPPLLHALVWTTKKTTPHLTSRPCFTLASVTAQYHVSATLLEIARQTERSQA
jgi:hypothetical protein